MGRTLLGTTTMDQSGPGSEGNKGVSRIPQNFTITGISPSDCLVSYLGHSLGRGYPSAEQSVYSTATVRSLCSFVSHIKFLSVYFSDKDVKVLFLLVFVSLCNSTLEMKPCVDIHHNWYLKLQSISKNSQFVPIFFRLLAIQLWYYLLEVSRAPVSKQRFPLLA